MKTSIVMIGFFSAMMFGCASTSAQMPSNIPTNETKQEAKKKEPDNFDKAGFIFSDGSRWIWNSSVKMWQWIDSPKHEDELKKAGNIVKELIKGAYNGAVEEYSKK